MDSLISRQAAIKTAISWYDHCFEDGESVAGLTAGLKNLPAADVVEVVRCKDCKDYDIINQPYDEGFCRKLNYSVEKNSFCSYGERRTDGEVH